MFNNIGKKIKGLASFYFWFFSIVIFIAAIGSAAEEGGFEAMAAALVGSAIGIVITYIASIFIAGFAKLVENSEMTTEYIKEIKASKEVEVE